MACFSPLRAFQRSDGSVVFVERGDIVKSLDLPCGQCVGCRLERSRQWAVRCMHEAQCHENNCFITLTYNQDNLPSDCSLNYRHFQLFMKRLRKRFNSKISFYMCGEYGENFNRPHFHACLFGINFPDLVLIGKSPAGSPIYQSNILGSLWTAGFSSVGTVTFESAAYVARYIMKKVTGDAADDHYKYIVPDTGEVVWRTPEFNRMSLKPAIGARWFEKFSSDVFPHDRVISNGVPCKPPRYYDKVFKRHNPIVFEGIQFQRELDARSRSADNTVERLNVRRLCAEARLARLSRSI